MFLFFSIDLWYSSCIVALDLVWPRITGKLPGYLSPSAGLKFADVPNGLAAISKVPAAGWGQILAYMAFCEVSQDQSPGTPAAAGDFGFKVLTASDPEEKTKKLSAELANGRLAMMAIIGMFFQAHLLLFSLDNWLLKLLKSSIHSFQISWVQPETPSYAGCEFLMQLNDSAWVLACWHAGWPDRKRLGRLGQLHRFSFASLWERVGRASASWVLGSCWVHSGWQRGGLQATSSDWVEARQDFYVGNHGLHYTWATGPQTLFFGQKRLQNTSVMTRHEDRTL